MRVFYGFFFEVFSKAWSAIHSNASSLSHSTFQNVNIQENGHSLMTVRISCRTKIRQMEIKGLLGSHRRLKSKNLSFVTVVPAIGMGVLFPKVAED